MYKTFSKLFFVFILPFFVLNAQSKNPEDASKDYIWIERSDLLEVLELYQVLENYVVATAGEWVLPQLDGRYSTRGESRYCCHYSSSSFPGARFCRTHTSYAYALAKAWCIANVPGDYDHTQSDECSPCSDGGGDCCDFID